MTYKEVVEQDFQLSFEVDLEKGSDAQDSDWKIKGIASVEVPDIEEETLIIKGMDTSYLENHGLINWNHGKLPQYIIGEIDKAEKIYDPPPAVLKVEGTLWKGTEVAKEAHKLMKALESGKSRRKMRLSLEGKAVQRQDKRVVKSRITNVALTMNPINIHTYAILTKGMCMHPEAESCMHCGLCAGFAKAATTDSIAPVMVESIDKRLKELEKEGGGKKKIKKLTKADALCLLINKGYSVNVSERVLNLIFK